MYEVRHKKLLSKKRFIKRLLWHLLFGLCLIGFSLGIGMAGYHHFEKMDWIDAYENASMILSGMGPVTDLHTSYGKIFAGTYALFSGILFLVVIAITFAPIFHRFLHKFFIKDPTP